MKTDISALQKRMKELDDPWFIPGETQLDTTGLSPQYRPRIVEEDSFNVPLADSERYRENWARDAVLNPEVLSSLAEVSNLTEDEKAVLKHYGDKNPSFTFHCGDWKVQAKYDRGAWNCLAANEETGERKKFTLGGHDKHDKDGVMSHCSRYLIPKLPWRKLTESELLAVARMAPGSPESAIYTYINFALPDIDEDVSANPKYQKLCDEIIWFVVENHYPEFDESARAFMQERLGTRPLTWHMAKELFAMYREQKFENTRRPSLLFNPASFEPEPETPESIADELENLPDSAIADLRQRTLRLKATGR